MPKKTGRKEEGEDREVRCYPVLIRADPGSGAGEGEGHTPRIEGIAAVYNQETVIETWSGSFYEVIEPGFFEGVLNDDARALWNHNTDLVLGRVKSGTLRLEDGEDGLGFEVDPPATQWGKDAVVSISRGDVDQCSFAFSVKLGGDEWREGEGGRLLRVLKRGGCSNLYDVSPVTFPAYAQTSVAVRSRLEGDGDLEDVESHSGEADQADPEASDPGDGTSETQAQVRVRARNRKRLLDIKKKR